MNRIPTQAPPCGEQRIGLDWQVALLLHFLAFSAFFIFFYRHQVNVDGISYLSLAHKYLDGEFTHAITGHWAPMMSWLLAPLLCLGVEDLMAYRLLAAGIGLATLVGLDIFFRDLQLGKATRLTYLFSLSPVIAWCAENDVGSDLLCACTLIFYLHSVIGDGYLHDRSAGVRAGFLGGLSYLAKNYNFYFFLLHFTFINCWYWRKADKGERRTVVARFLAGMVVFTLVAGCWVGVLSTKYHRLTAGTAGAMSLLLMKVGPDGYPMIKDGLMPPPNQSAVSVWEDPATIVMPRWNPLASGTDLSLYLHSVTGNVAKYLSGLAMNYVFMLTVAYLAFLLVSRRWIDPKVEKIAWTILLYPVGYFILYYDGQRYVWINTFMLYLISAHAVDQACQRYRNLPSIRLAVAVVLYVSLLSLTMLRVKNDYALDVANLNQLYHTSNTIRQYYNLGRENVASQSGDWNHTVELAYFLRARYFGRVRENVSDKELAHDLKRYQIRYLFVYGPLKNHLAMLEKERTFPMAPDNLTIYKVNEQPLVQHFRRPDRGDLPAQGWRDRRKQSYHAGVVNQ